MPSAPYQVTLTGLSTTGGNPTYFPDYMIRPFRVSVQTVLTSTAAAPVFSVQHTLDYTGSSTFISSNATWFNSSGTSGSSVSSFTAYDYPVTAIRLNSTAGSSVQTITMTIVQAG